MKKLKLGILLLVSCLFLTGCGCSKQDKTYTITFDSNGGTSVSSQTVKENETVTKPKNPTRDGYEFDGWYLKLTDTDKYDFTKKVTSSFTLTAKWIKSGEVSYTITLDVDGKTTTVKTDENGLIEKPTDPAKSGYKFDGWYLDDEEYDFSKPFTKDSTLVAKFTKVTGTTSVNKPTTTKPSTGNNKPGTGNDKPSSGNTEEPTITKYTIKFVVNGKIVSTQEVEKGNKLTLPSTPSKSGYKFDGWYYGSTKVTSNTVATKDMVIEARWTKNTVYDYEVIPIKESIANQAKLYLLKDNEHFAGYADVTLRSGKTVTLYVPADGYIELEENIKDVKNIRLNK